MPLKLVVCLKQVPDTSAQLRVRPNALEPERSGFLPVINPYDEFALEEALGFCDTAGEGEVILITLAGEDVEEAIFHGLAMGAHRAIVLRLPTGATPDPPSTGRLLAQAVKAIEADIILCGDRAVDDDAAQVGPIIAEQLRIPQICGAESLRIDADKRTVEVRCRRGDSIQVVLSGLPCIVTFVRGLKLPRYSSMEGIFSAHDKPVECRAVPYEPRMKAMRRTCLVPLLEDRLREMIVGETPAETAELFFRKIVSFSLI